LRRICFEASVQAVSFVNGRRRGWSTYRRQRSLLFPRPVLRQGEPSRGAPVNGSAGIRKLALIQTKIISFRTLRREPFSPLRRALSHEPRAQPLCEHDERLSHAARCHDAWQLHRGAGLHENDVLTPFYGAQLLSSTCCLILVILVYRPWPSYKSNSRRQSLFQNTEQVLIA
jgi:hypothetical protein